MSREELILIKRLRKLVIITSTYSIFLGVFIVYLNVIPVYVIEGVIKGYITLTRYELTYYDTPVRLDVLFSVNFLTISMFILSTYLILTGILTLYLFFSAKDFNTGIRLLFSGALSLIAYSGLFIALTNKVLPTAAAQLNLNFNQVTSAGTLYLGESRVYETYLASYLLSPLTVFIVIQTYVFLATATYTHMVLIDEYRLTRQPPYREIKYRIVGS